MPAPLLTLGAAIDTGWARLNRRLPKLSFDRARYFCHPDWVATAERRPDAAFWSPAIETPAGLAAVAAWYRETGRSEEHTSELQSLMRISYAVFCCIKKKH